MPKSNIPIISTPVFEWYAVRCRSNDMHQKDMCSKEVEFCAQNVLTILGTNNQPNWGNLDNHLMGAFTVGVLLLGRRT